MEPAGVSSVPIQCCVEAWASAGKLIRKERSAGSKSRLKRGKKGMKQSFRAQLRRSRAFGHALNGEAKVGGVG